MKKAAIELTSTMAQNVLNRFDIKTITCDETGLHTLYKAWCRHIPFDNFWKRLELTGATLSAHHQMNPNQFFEIWLQHGLGGTCWTTTHAMAHLLEHVGFTVRFIAGSMGATGSSNHGSILVSFSNGKEYIVDTSILNDQPIALTTKEINDNVHPIKLIPKEASYDLFFEFPSKRDFMLCAIDTTGITFEKIEHLYQESLTHSLFNDCVYIRKNTEAGIHTIIGTTLYTKNAHTIEKRTLDKEERKHVLMSIFGLSEAITHHITTTNLFDIPEESNLINITT